MGTVEIDTIELMYEAFQACRVDGARGGPLVRALRPVLARVRELGALTLDEADPCLTDWPQPSHGLAQRGGAPTERALTARNQVLFEVIDRAAGDLDRLCASDAHLAARNLGYALHSLPGLLATPSEFDRKAYTFCLRFIAYHWRELSEELKVALARLLQIDRAGLEAFVGREGFASSMFDAAAR